ncbi:unnamed protein product [Litomosoides sigmodontis]|uniref:Uncharacterized protein n=1 Tax=Litomosoides sigmodontis TaxID=42156 RepID=A0A3P6THB2_LITSI|nr:unnamed protein product [Litomosoides sigmodontis]
MEWSKDRFTCYILLCGPMEVFEKRWRPKKDVIYIATVRREGLQKYVKPRQRHGFSLCVFFKRGLMWAIDSSSMNGDDR